MANTTLPVFAYVLFAAFSLCYCRPGYDADFRSLLPLEPEANYVTRKALEQADAHTCTNDLDMCECIAAKPGRCDSDVEVRGACAHSCKACDKKKRNLYLGELSKLKRRFVRDFLNPKKRGCSDQLEDCDCMVKMCRKDKMHEIYMRKHCPKTCGFC